MVILILLAQSFEDRAERRRNMALQARFTEAQCVFPKTRRSLNTAEDYKILNRSEEAAKMC